MAQLNDLLVTGNSRFLNEINGKIDWSNILSKPTIPAAANNGTLTIQKNGTNVQTFTANQSTNVTANITVPTKVSELTNDSGYTSNVGTITGIKMNGASKGTSGVVDLGTVITAHQDISGKADTDDLARGYSSDTVQLYNTGDLVYHDGDMYRCINGTSGGNWISSCWQRTSVATELENKIEGLMVAGSSGGSYASEVTTSIWFDPNQFNYLTGSHKVELNSNFDPSNKVSKTGDTMTGDISWNGETGCTSGLYWKEYGYGDKFKIAPSFSGFNDDNFLGFQAAVGGTGTDPDLAVILKIHPSGKITTTNQVIGKNPATSWIGARDNACFINPNFANNGSYYPVISTKSKSGTWSIGVLSNEEQLRFCWESDSNYSSGKNESTSVILRATAGTIALTSEILPKAGGTMTGNLVCGNTTIYSSGSNGGRNSMIIGDDCKLGDCNVGGMLGLQAASGTNCGIRLYNGSGGLIGGFQSTNGTPQWINSSGTATTISLAGHNHSYLPLSGGTVTGDTTFSKKVQVSGIFKCAVISRYDNNDSGYVNHVNQENNAYRPVRASAFTTMSCKHTKTNIVDISEEDALKLLDIRPVNFDYVEEVGGQKDQIGVLAEDTYEVLPKVVSVPDDYVEEDFDISKGIHQPLPSVDYAKFVPYLIKMVQIQEREIDSLKKIIDKLEINI